MSKTNVNLVIKDYKKTRQTIQPSERIYKTSYILNQEYFIYRKDLLENSRNSITLKRISQLLYDNFIASIIYQHCIIK